MSPSTVQSSASPAAGSSAHAPPKAMSQAITNTFAATLDSVGNGTPYTDDDVKKFFASKPDQQQIADRAAALGLTEDQIATAMRVGGYGGSDEAALKTEIEHFVATANSGYAWGTNGSLTTTKAQSHATGSDEKAMPLAEDIKAFYATKPTEQQVVAKVKALGLNAAQMVRFEVAGEGMDLSRVSAQVLESRYVEAANKLGTDIGGGKNGGWTSYFSPTLGRAITNSEIQSFFANNPTQAQIFQKAADLGIGVAAVNNMMVGAGITKPEDANKAYGRMDFALYQGVSGYSLDQYGHVVPGGGHTFVLDADGASGSWQARTQANGSVNTTA